MSDPDFLLRNDIPQNALSLLGVAGLTGPSVPRGLANGLIPSPKQEAKPILLKQSKTAVAC